jgi:predicted 3-demethylubiquinone-9 3-methyltransferase (glyoxalase superfamily)
MVAEEAVHYFLSLFNGSRMETIARYGDAGASVWPAKRLRDDGDIRHRRTGIRGAQWRTGLYVS